MKCVHCSHPLSRTDWFCPDCKRGVTRRSGSRMVWAPLAGVGLGVLAASLWMGTGRHAAVVPQLPVEATVPVSIRPVETSPAVEEALRALQPQLPPVEAAREELRHPEAAESEPATAKQDLQPEPASEGAGAVTVMTDSNVETFVYLNGGSLLGRAPLEAARVPAGEQTLVFWSPSVGGRSTRRIRMYPGENVVLIHNVTPRSEFDTEGG